MEPEARPPAAAGTARPSRRTVVLLVATALCYAVGYPVALVGHSAVGWVFVALGGPLLLVLLFIAVRHVHRQLEAERPDAGGR